MWCNVVAVALVELKCLLCVRAIDVLLWWRSTCGGMIWLSFDVVEWWGWSGMALEWLLRASLVLRVGRIVGRLCWGLNGGWMGALGMGSLERVGGVGVSAGGL